MSENKIYQFETPRHGLGVLAAASWAALPALPAYALFVVAGPVYGYGIFLATPFVMGYAAAALRGRSPGARLSARLVAGQLAVVEGCLLFLLMGWEGVVCLAMALPPASVCAALGGLFFWFSRDQPPAGRRAALGCVLIVPTGFDVAAIESPRGSVHSVTTAVEVAASPERVWRRVVEFPPLDPPRDWIFRLGAAYPLRAEIDGRGVGAKRRCVFSTGAFVEPITVWDEPRRLAFSVASNPPPLREWSPFGPVRSAHLEGFLEARSGEFLLEPAANGGTRLIGTTRYRHGMRPDGYWRLWSDEIIRRIHLRVLLHIRDLAEADSADVHSSGGISGTNLSSKARSSN